MLSPQQYRKKQRIRVRWFDEVKPVVETAYKHFGTSEHFTVNDLSKYIVGIDINRIRGIIQKSVNNGDFAVAGKTRYGRRYINKYRVTEHVFKNGKYDLTS